MLVPTRPLVMKALDVAYAGTDLLMIGWIMIPALSESPGGSRVLIAAILSLLVSDITFTYFGNVTSSWIYRYLDVPYYIAYFLLAVAGLQQKLHPTKTIHLSRVS